jgi:hypothetical protein
METTTENLLQSVQPQSVTQLDEINIALAVISKKIQKIATTLDGCSEQLPDEHLCRAQLCIIEAIFENGKCIGALKADAAIDAAGKVE